MFEPGEVEKALGGWIAGHGANDGRQLRGECGGGANVSEEREQIAMLAEGAIQTGGRIAERSASLREEATTAGSVFHCA